VIITATQGSEKPLIKKPNLLGFLFYWVLDLYWVFPIFYLNEQLGNSLVDLAHQLSFYLDLPVH